jgi:hypothetical protein
MEQLPMKKMHTEKDHKKMMKIPMPMKTSMPMKTKMPKGKGKKRGK